MFSSFALIFWASHIWASLFKLNSYFFKPCTPKSHIFKAQSNIFKPCFYMFVLCSYISDFCFHISKLLVLKLCSHISKSFSYFFKPQFFKPHSLNLTLTFMGPLFWVSFFWLSTILNPDLNIPDLGLWKVFPVISFLECFSKQSNWQIYKDNISDIKLGCRAIKKSELKLGILN